SKVGWLEKDEKTLFFPGRLQLPKTRGIIESLKDEFHGLLVRSLLFRESELEQPLEFLGSADFSDKHCGIVDRSIRLKSVRLDRVENLADADWLAQGIERRQELFGI